MAAEDPAADAGEAGATGPLAALRRMLGHLLELLQLRLELLSTELEAEKLRLFAALTQGLLALLMAGAGLVMLSICLLLLSPEGWRWLAALLLGILYAGLAWWSWRCACKQLSQLGGIFAGSAAELTRDRDALKS